MNNLPVAVSANGKSVYASLMQAPLSTSVAHNPHLLTLVGEVVAQLDLTLQSITIEHNMGRPIGYSERLETRDKDTIFYARMNKLPEYTRFVRQRNAEQTTYITFILEQDAEGSYTLVDAWLGNVYPPIPSPTNDTQLSKDYWTTHAVVFNGQSLLASTITKVCPY